MKQKLIIEVEVPDGMMAVWDGKNVVLEDDLSTFPKTWEEFCKLRPNIKDGEAFINDTSNIESAASDVARSAKIDANILPSKDAAIQHLYMMKLHQLRDCYRRGWVPDWEDTTNKYCIVRRRDELIVRPMSHTYTFLAFRNEDIADMFVDNFYDLMIGAGDLI